MQGFRFVLASWRSRSFRWFVLTSSVVIGSSTAWVAAVLVATHHLRAGPPYPNASQLFVVSDSEGVDPQDLPGPAFVRWREWGGRPIEVAAFRRATGVLVGEEGLEQSMEAAFISVDLLSMIGVRPAVGRDFGPSNAGPEAGAAVVLAWHVAATLFGSPASSLSQRILVDGVPRTVIGVMPAGFWFPTVATEIWMPLEVVPFVRTGNRVSIPYYSSLARIPGDMPLADAVRILRDSTVQASPRFREGDSLTLAGISSIWYRTERRASRTITMFTVMLWTSAVISGCLLGFVWWTACRPIWEKAHTLGARSWHLKVELLAAALCVIVGSSLTMAGLLTVAGSLRVTLAVVPSRFEVQPSDLFWLASSTALASIAAAALPPALALHAAGRPTSMALRHWRRVLGAGGSWSGAAVVGQVALAIAALVAAMSLSGTMTQFVEQGYGFRVDSSTSVVTLRLRSASGTAATSQADAIGALQRQLAERQYGIGNVGIADRPPYEPPGLSVELSANGTKQMIGIRIFGDGYFSAAGIDIQGETSGLSRTSHGIVVSRSLAQWAGLKPGAALALTDDIWRVDGIAADVRQPQSVGSSMTIYLPYRNLHRLPARLQHDGLRSLVIVARGAPRDAGDHVEATAREVLGPTATVMAATTMWDAVADLAPHLRLGLRIARVFSVVVASIALCGLLGVWNRRLWHERRDVGVRLALGASVARVLLEEVGKAVRLVGASFVIAACVLLTTWPYIAAQLPSLSPPGPLELASVGGAAIMMCFAVVCGATLAVVQRPIRALLQADADVEGAP